MASSEPLVAPGELAVADHVYVIRNGALFAEGPREAFGGDTAALVSHWLSASSGS